MCFNSFPSGKIFVLLSDLSKIAKSCGTRSDHVAKTTFLVNASDKLTRCNALSRSVPSFNSLQKASHDANSAGDKSSFGTVLIKC
ncbi:hypothetical protein D3C80_1811960 [compost metagenome]